MFSEQPIKTSWTTGWKPLYLKSTGLSTQVPYFRALPVSLNSPSCFLKNNRIATRLRNLLCSIAAISQRRRFPFISLAFHRVSCRQIFSLKASKILNSLLGETFPYRRSRKRRETVSTCGGGGVPTSCFVDLTRKKVSEMSWPKNHSNFLIQWIGKFRG